MKKVFGMILAVIISITSVMCAFSWLKLENRKASADVIGLDEFSESKLENKVDILDPTKLYATYASEQKSQKAPFYVKTETLMEGYTFFPTENSKREVNSSYYLNEFSVMPNKSIFMWIFIPNENTYTLKLKFETAENYYISWEYGAYELGLIMDATTSAEITYGWKLFEFCVNDADVSAEISGIISSAVFNKMTISYVSEDGIYIENNNNKFAFYHVYQADSFSNWSTIVETVNYANYRVKDNFITDSYYIDEEIYFTSVVDMFDYLYVGQTNLFENYGTMYSWEIEVIDSDGKTYDKSFGDKFVFAKAGNHRLNFTIYEYKSSSSSAVVYIPYSVNAQMFVFGAFTNIDYEFEKGETKQIYFKISSYFEFDEESIEVLIDDKKKASVTYYVEDGLCHIKVKGLKAGDTSISVRVTGGRRGLNESEVYECSTDIKVTDSDEKSDTEVFLWVILGIYAVGFGIFVVISLVKARRVSVK